MLILITVPGSTSSDSADTADVLRNNNFRITIGNMPTF